MPPILTYVSDLLADAVAELYGCDPDDFTPRRQELATAAREAGQSAVAKQISGLRKPTRSAWVVNQLVRADPEVVIRLATLSAELRDGASDGARIRELTTARGRLVDELTRQGLRDLPAPPAALREEVAATLDAAIADPEVAANLGTLVRAAHWAGFGLAPLPAGAPAPRPPKPAAPAPAPAPAEAAADREHRHHDKLLSAERAVAQAGQATEAANTAEHDLEETVRRLEAELADARHQLAQARRQAYQAESKQRRAAAELSRLRE